MEFVAIETITSKNKYKPRAAVLETLSDQSELRLWAFKFEKQSSKRCQMKSNSELWML